MRSAYVTGFTAALFYLWIATSKQALGYSLARGCYSDPSHEGSELIGFYRYKMDWSNLADSVIKKCEIAAKIRGYRCFAIQYYGECWSGPSACETFRRLRPSNTCFCSLDRFRPYVKGKACPGVVGGEGTSFVYQVFG